MTDLQLILVILGSAAAIWQLGLLIAWSRMLGSGKYRSVTVGVGPGVSAVILFIVAVLV